jgi:membrane peptidoglycan carboxypeptidase
MTDSAHRQPPGRGPRRPLSRRTRALIAAQRATAARPRRSPAGTLGRLVAVAFLVGAIGLATVGGVAAIAGVGTLGALGSGLPDPAQLDSLTFDQPTIVYDRTGKVELARFERQDRRVVTFDQVPRLVLDATTTAEDRTFWQNDGFDPAAILAAAVQNVTGHSGERGASTITQQLVRARLLPQSVVNGDKYYRKVLEVIQASRLTSAFPGEAGKDKIITAYLNEIYYGHEAYGIAAAAKIYFGVTDLSQLTVAEAALLAGLPQAPSVYDPYRYAVPDANGHLVVPANAPPVVRRNYILQNMPEFARWTRLDPAQLQAALSEPVVLAGVQTPQMKAPQFSWAVRDQLVQLLGSLDAVETGGYKVITTLDWNAQQLAERDMFGAVIIPNLPRSKAAGVMKQMHFTKADRRWINNLRGRDLHDGAMVALDYRTGDVLAYVGSGSYYDPEQLASPRFSPEYDAAAARRQPGSTFKAIVYSAAFQAKVLTPGSLLLDVQTQFGKSWAPQDADLLERGPILARQAVQQSLNIPAIRVMQRVGSQPVADEAQALGIRFNNGEQSLLDAGLAGAIGTVEASPLDMTGAFGGLANGGSHVPSRMILSIQGPDGRTVYQAPKPVGTQALSPQSAFLMTDILAGNTDPRQNPVWASALAIHNGPKGSRRPAAAKTGTSDKNRDLSIYGYLAPPKDPNAAGLAVGIWMGNSDFSVPHTSHPANSLHVGAVWEAFIRDYTAHWPVASFKPPDGVVKAKIDAWSGGKPGPWTRKTTTEWFLDGTQPGAKGAIDQAGLLYTHACGTWEVDPVKAELGPDAWKADVQNWLDRARRGTGIRGPLGSRTAYLPGQSSWGGPLVGPCHTTSPPKAQGPPVGHRHRGHRPRR